MRNAPQPTPGAVQLDGDKVAQVLTEFVQTDYALQTCEYCNVGPTDYGQVWGMFESVRPIDSRLVIKLKPSFEQRSEKLLDKLKLHLQKRMPEISSLEYKSRTITKTLIVGGGSVARR